MADQQLNIKVTKQSDELTKLRRELKEAGNELLQLRQKFGENSAQVKIAEQNYKSLGQQLINSRTYLRDVGATAKMSRLQLLEMGENITVVAAGLRSLVMPVMNFGKEVVLTAARTETLGVVVEQVGKIAGKSKEQVNGYVDSVKAMGITTQVAREVITLMIQNQLDSARASELARVAQDAAVIADENSSQTLRGLIEAIVTRNSLMLRTRGIIIDVDRTITEHAKTLGKNKDALTESEKSQILLNAVIEKGADIAGTYEASMETAGKKIQSFDRYVEEAKNEVGERFLPVLNTGIDVATDFAKAITGSSDAMQVATGITVGLGGALAGILPTIASLKIAFPSLAATIKTSMTGAAGSIALLTGKLALLLAATSFAVSKINEIADEQKRLDNEHPELKGRGDILGGKDASLDMLNKQREGSFYTQEELKAFKEKKKVVTDTNTELGKTNKIIDDIAKKLGGSRGTGSKTSVVGLITNDIVDLQKQIEELQSKMNITDPQSTLFRIYTDQIKELNKEIEKLSAKDTFLVRLKEYSDVLKNLSPALFKEQSTVSRRETIGLPETVEIGIGYREQLKEQVKILQDSLSTFSGSFLSLFDMLNIKKDNFVYGMVKGFDTVLNTVGMIAKIIQSIIQVNQTVGMISSLLSLIPGGNILGTIFGATSGGGGTSGAMGMNNQLNMAGASGMQSQRVVVAIEGEMGRFFKVARTEFYKNQTMVSLS